AGRRHHQLALCTVKPPSHAAGRFNRIAFSVDGTGDNCFDFDDVWVPAHRSRSTVLDCPAVRMPIGIDALEDAGDGSSDATRLGPNDGLWNDARASPLLASASRRVGRIHGLFFFDDGSTLPRGDL